MVGGGGSSSKYRHCERGGNSEIERNLSIKEFIGIIQIFPLF